MTGRVYDLMPSQPIALLAALDDDEDQDDDEDDEGWGDDMDEVNRMEEVD